MIHIHNIVKSFHDKVIFNKFNLKIDKGEFVVFSGPSGCGKTTLLNMIGALEPVDEGEILVEGKAISQKKHHLSYFRTKVAFLFQNFALIDHKTVRDNLTIIGRDCRSGVSIDDALSRVGLMDKLNHKIYTLSGGEQQRVALARLMLKKCDIILADEPTGSLDRKNAENVIEILIELNREGKTIIMVTHDEVMKQRGSRVIELC